MDYEQDFDIRLLGQSGCRLQFSNAIVYCDPYLSNSVQELDAPDLSRLTPIPYPPEDVQDADWVLITHAHIDHCDPKTLPQLAAASPECQFLCPYPVIEILRSWNVESSRLHLAQERWERLRPDLEVHAIPAAHPVIDRDENQRLAAVGYLMRCAGSQIYLAGDTSVDQEVIDALLPHSPIDIALLPVNERNFFRDRRGIIGNMSIREAFLLAEEVGVQRLVPVHWDMFAVNSAYPEEIRIVHSELEPSFQLVMDPSNVST